MKIATARFLVVLFLVAAHGPAQTSPAFTTLHIFTGSPDGAEPYASVAGKDGVLYGTTLSGGANNFGTVFSLTPPASPGGAWSEQVLYSFTGGSDGGEPAASLLIGGRGILYGTTTFGGDNGGTIFALIPPALAGGAWTEKTIYAFPTFYTGYDPSAALVNSAGVLYGTARYGAGGPGSGDGAVFSLSPPASPGGAWTEKVLHIFMGASDGSQPESLVFGHDGVLYGETGVGGPGGWGTVYSLTPPASPGGSWTEQVLYSFTGGSDGSEPSGLRVAADGVLYGTASIGGLTGCEIGCGVVFSLTPPGSPDGSWTEQTLYQFTGGTDGGVPFGGVVIGQEGRLYGTTSSYGELGGGTVWELAPPAAGGPWALKVLHAFSYKEGDFSYAGLWMGNRGALYGTTYVGGASVVVCPPACGAAFSVIP